jgi:hypothetical protein
VFLPKGVEVEPLRVDEVLRVDDILRVEGIEEYYNTPPKPVYEDSDDTPEPKGL